jgi:hypothetical protein
MFTVTNLSLFLMMLHRCNIMMRLATTVAGNYEQRQQQLNGQNQLICSYPGTKA